MRDYKRAKASTRVTLDDELVPKPLDPRLRDHSLTGEWKDCRDCHIKPDLVLIYQKPNTDTLRLVRLGSHRELDL